MYKRKRIHPGDGDPRHGTSNGYATLGCRCAECTEANTIKCGQYARDNPWKMKEARDKRRARQRRERNEHK